jgi:uncharacterized membrane protein
MLKWGSPSILATAAAVLVALWDRIPQRWAIHWNTDDVPNGWATKSAGGVFGLLVLGVAQWGVLEAIARSAGGRAKAPEVGAATTEMLRIVGLATSTLLAGLAVWLPLGQPRSPAPVVIGALALLGFAVLFATVRVGRKLRELRARGIAGLEGWQGLIYKNADDPRLWVPKLSGMGWTLNYANAWAWPMTVLLLLSPVLIVVLAKLAAAK